MAEPVLLQLGKAAFDRRVAGSFNGQPFNDLITVDLAGKKYGKPGFYKTDWNNFQPRVGFNWNPRVSGGAFGRLTGGDKLVIRGGYARTHDSNFININLNIASAFPFVATINLPAQGAFAQMPDSFVQVVGLER